MLYVRRLVSLRTSREIYFTWFKIRKKIMDFVISKYLDVFYNPLCVHKLWLDIKAQLTKSAV